MLSFRLRALVMVIFVAVTASGSAAWLTLQQTTRQARQTRAAGQSEMSRITEDLRSYGLQHGTWIGVESTVSRLATSTGQRVRLVTDAGVVAADSDLLAGRRVRPTSGQPVLIDPRPRLNPAEGADTGSVLAQASAAFRRYRAALPYAACLTRAGLSTAEVTDQSLPPGVAAGALQSPAGACGDLLLSPLIGKDTESFDRKAKACLPRSHAATSCVKGLFSQMVAVFSADLMAVYVGAIDQRDPPLAVGPVVGLAAGVAVLVVLATLLIAGGVLKPVRALTAASRRLGGGDLDQRVTVSGHDEIAQLGRTFNAMATSLQAGEERQRRLVNDIAHELRTPLANLLGYLEALKDGVLPPTRDLLESLHEEAVLQQRIVNDLQDLALAEAGTLTYHFGDVDLADSLAATVVAQTPGAKRSKVTLGADASAGLVVWADADRLRQVLGNLVVNALRATPPGGSVHLSARRIPEGGAVIEVADTGSGLSEEQLRHVFDRFWRADPARGRDTGGSGLGLAVVRQIVTDHRGRIDVRSAVGAGTTFSITLVR
jgi:two-component system sensor histidine kinase BaeS